MRLGYRALKAREKIFERDALAAGLGEIRADGGRVVLCNGIFDLLHVGHVRALEEARGLGDLLVVALNDDAGARRLRGADGPLQPAAERAEIVAALGCVDRVTLFPETDLAATLRLLRPAVHAKGRDYDPGRIPEEELRAHAELEIELAFVGDEKRHSSSRLRARLAER